MKNGVFILLLMFAFNAMAQRDTLPPKAQVVGDYEANGYTVIFPLGWSKDGHFAYIYQDVNGRGGADIYRYQMIVHKNKIGKAEYKSEVVYNMELDTMPDLYKIIEDQVDTSYWGNSFFKYIYWENYKDTINKVLDAYKIIRDDAVAVQSLGTLDSLGMKVTEDKERDTKNAIVLDRKIDIFLHVEGKGKRAIFTKTNALNADGWAIDQYGNYTDLLFYEVSGVIKSPHSDHYLLYLIEYTMGYEETAERVILIPFSKIR